MKATYYKDTMRSYMIIPCPPEAETEGYQYRMLEMNRIDGILSCGLRYIDGERFLYYDITGKQSMRGLYEGRKIRGEELFHLLRDIERVSGSLAGYLLDEQHLMLSAEQIFYDFGTGNYFFTYYPGAVTEPEIFRFLAEEIEGSDKQAAAAAYRLCALAGGDRQALREAIRSEAVQKTGTDRNGPERYGTGSGGPERRRPSSGAEETRQLSGTGKEGRSVYLSERKGGGNESPQRASGRTREKSFFRRDKKESFFVKETAVDLSSGKKEESGQSFGKKQIALRIFLIVILLAGAGGLIAAPFFIYISERERRLCIAGTILLAAAAGLLTAELILKVLRERRIRREYDRNREPVYSESDEKDMPMFGAEGRGDYRLRENVGETVRFAEQEATGRLYGRERGSRIDLWSLPVTVGKAAAHVDVVLTDPSVSRVHARIYKGEDGSIEVRDLNSTNGTWINGVRLSPNEKARVQRGDEVRFGGVEYEYR